MPGGRYLLDTNIIIALLDGDEDVKKSLREADQVFLPVIALGELFYGVQKSRRMEDNIKRLCELAAVITILPCDMETAVHYGNIKNALLKKGRPLPENDIWIAACAKQYSMIMVSRDIHFTYIDDMHVERW